ncbi:MAG: hypothetical protein OEW15_18455, partial [Nitrospirota bacterium]|nr:hypothetical protein [Nitrospirota bacterium]
MKQIVLPIILALFFSAYTAAAEHLPGCPSSSHAPEQCASLIEKDILSKHKDLFDRKKDTLTVHLKNGKKKTYITQLGNSPETFEIFLLVNYYAGINYALILDQYWEGLSYILLHLATGVELDAKGYALLSPQKKHFVVYAKDIDAEYSPNVLRIYQIKADGVSIEFDATPDKWGPSDVHWISETEISFSKDSHDVNSPHYSKATYEAREQKRLKYHDG